MNASISVLAIFWIIILSYGQLTSINIVRRVNEKLPVFKIIAQNELLYNNNKQHLFLRTKTILIASTSPAADNLVTIEESGGR